MWRLFAFLFVFAFGLHKAEIAFVSPLPDKQEVRVAATVPPTLAKVVKDSALDCMARNIYHEARGEPTKGQYAVGLVVLNRVKSGIYPDDVCSVIYQDSQFSWVQQGYFEMSNIAKREASYMIAKDLLDGKIQDFTKGATHYHAVYVKPRWSKKLQKVTKISNHIFYRSI